MSSTGRTVLIVVLVLVALPLLFGGMMMGGGMGSGMMWGWQGADRWDGWRGMWMMIPGILVVVGLVAALVWGLGSNASSSSSNGLAARELLDARYARGEITREQYQQMRGDIDS